MIQGHIAATYAPMHADQTLNLNVVHQYHDYLKRNGVSGAFINGSTGDFTSLSVEERKSLTKEWSKIRSSDFCVIDHVGHTSLIVAKELAKHSADKVDALAVLAPYYFRINDLDKLLFYCEEIAACAPELPFYYYHIPVLSGANFKMSEFLPRAIDLIPNFAGVKYTANDLIDLRRCLENHKSRVDILFGYDEMFLDSLLLDVPGWVGSTYNHLMPLYKAIQKSFEEGNWVEANSLQDKAVQFVEILNKPSGFNGAGKSFMKYLGVDCGPSRYPHNTLSDQFLEQLANELKELGILKWCNT